MVLALCSSLIICRQEIFRRMFLSPGYLQERSRWPSLRSITCATLKKTEPLTKKHSLSVLVKRLANANTSVLFSSHSFLPLLLFFSSLCFTFIVNPSSCISSHASDDHQSKSPSPQSTPWKNRPAPMVVHSSLLHRLDAVALYSYRLPLRNGIREGLVLRGKNCWGEIAPYPGRSRKYFKIASINCFMEMMAPYFPRCNSALRTHREPRARPSQLPSTLFSLALPKKFCAKLILPSRADTPSRK